MNLSELIDDNGLQQDKWSLSGVVFSKNENLKLLGWSGKNKCNAKYYIFHCSICEKRPELFGEGYFRSLKGKITSGGMPCGCSTKYEWSKEQYRVLCKEKARNLGFAFIDFKDEWLHQNTKIYLLCCEHGIWDTCTIANLLLRESGCPKCGIERTRRSMLKPDEEMIASFFASGAFHLDTKFWRSDRKSSQGRPVYWWLYCPDCNSEGEATSVDLQNGKRPCSCSKNRQQECYINLISNPDGGIIAVKFGIATASKRRVRDQNYKSKYRVTLHLVYIFPDVSSCKKAERECKYTLECGILTKEDMPDGYTETTDIENMQAIIKIYEKHGGQLCT